jgi:hypothetical protein
MKWVRRVVFLIVFCFAGTGLAYAVLQTASANKPDANRNTSSKLVSDADDARDSAESLSGSSSPYGGSPGTMQIRLRGAPPVSAVAAPNNNAAAGQDYPMGRSRRTHPAAVKPDGVSPVVQQVSGPWVDTSGGYTKLRSTKPGTATFSFSSKTDS